MATDEDADEAGLDAEDGGLPTSLPSAAASGPIISTEFESLIKTQVDKLPEDSDWHTAIVAYAKGEGDGKRMGVAVVVRKGGLFNDRDNLSFSLAGEKPKQGKFGWKAELIYAL